MSISKSLGEVRLWPPAVRWLMLTLALLVAGVACGTGTTLPLAPGSNTTVERNCPKLKSGRSNWKRPVLVPV